MRYVFLMEVINTGLLVLVYKWSWPVGLEKAGVLVVFTLAAMCFTTNLGDLLRYLGALLVRFKDRGFKLQLKQNLDDEFDDLPNSKKIFQEDLNILYLGPEFTSHKKLSRSLSFLFVCLLYSSFLPSLFAVFLVFTSLTYLSNKFLILNYY